MNKSLKMTPRLKERLIKKQKGLNNVSHETKLKISELKIKGLEAEVKTLKHIVNMYANYEIYKNI